MLLEYMSTCVKCRLICDDHIVMVVYNSEQLKMFFDCWKSQFGALMSIVIMTFALQCRFNDCNKADD